MPLIKETARCWKEILPAFKEFGFSEEELEFEIKKPGKGECCVVVFHPRFLSMLKQYAPMEKIERHFTIKEGVIAVISNNGQGLANIQSLFAVALDNLGKEKSNAIINTKVMIMYDVERVLAANLPAKHEAHVYYRKGVYYATVKIRPGKLTFIQPSMTEATKRTKRIEEVISKFESKIYFTSYRNSSHRLAVKIYPLKIRVDSRFPERIAKKLETVIKDIAAIFKNKDAS